MTGTFTSLSVYLVISSQPSLVHCTRIQRYPPPSSAESGLMLFLPPPRCPTPTLFPKNERLQLQPEGVLRAVLLLLGHREEGSIFPAPLFVSP